MSRIWEGNYIVKSPVYQKTVSGTVTISGIGLHSGSPVEIKIIPSQANSGIFLRRVDIPSSVGIKAHSRNISSTKLCTVIGKDRNSIATVEHLMAAFALLGIDNAMVEVGGPEIPIMDGSAIPFVRSILEVGVEPLPAMRSYFKVTKPFEVSIGDQFIRVLPFDGLKIDCEIDFSDNIIGRQKAEYLEGSGNLERVLGSRTFCHINDVHAMRQQGLARGGSLENAVVVSDAGVINEDGLRSKDEFVQHKLLDIIGDLFLLGRPLIGYVEAFKPGHSLQAYFMKELLDQKANYLEVASQFYPSKSLFPLQGLYAMG